MSEQKKEYFETQPYGKLGIISLRSYEERAKDIDRYIVEWRGSRVVNEENPVFDGYKRDSYLIPVRTPRFGTGEAKGIINKTVRGDDVYIITDVLNYSITYTVSGIRNHMSPDDHFQDLKRIIAAISGKARRINVIMPFLYESRQHRRTGRESMDCAMALQELVAMGVDDIITFDAHDTRVSNSIPNSGFESIPPTYQYVKNLIASCPEFQIDKDHLMVISPDEGGMNRAIYMASNLGVDMGTFYKRRDYSVVIDGRNPIVAHQFLGDSVEGKDVIIVDDMISSGDSMLEVSQLLKEKGARNIYICCTFGIFTNGLKKFDEAYKKGYFSKMFTTNLVYQTEELLSRDYYVSCDMNKFIAVLIDTLNHDSSISALIEPTERIKEAVREFKKGRDKVTG